VQCYYYYCFSYITLVLPSGVFSIQTVSSVPDSMSAFTAIIFGRPTIMVGLFFGSTSLTERLRGCCLEPGGSGIFSTNGCVVVIQSSYMNSSVYSLVFLDSSRDMVKDVSHIIFDSATTNVNVEDDEVFGPTNAIDLTKDSAFFAKVTDESKDSTLELCCHCNDVVTDEIQVLEIAFHKGKLRKTKFSVDYIDEEDKKHHVGTYESKGETSNFEKFLMPEKIKNFKGLVITFKGNNDRSPWFAVKGIRLARFIEKTL